MERIEDGNIIQSPDPIIDALDEDDFEEAFEEAEPEYDEWFGYRAPRLRICIDRTGGRFPGF